ncbi:MAG: PQQ-dependent sugar dehydrogenase [Aquaticitalea sp.]
MRLILLISVLIANFTLQAQQRDSVITKETRVHVYKPKLVDATEKRISELKLPKGFRIAKYAEGLGKARMMAATPSGNVYVTNRDGDIFLLKNTGGNEMAEKTTVHNLKDAHGLAIDNNQLYIVTVNEVYRSDIQPDGDLSTPEKIIDGLPDGGQHPNRTLAFGPDGKLYVSVGSTCNACDETSEESATLLQFDRDGSNKKIWAKGLRNTIGFDWHPLTGALYGLDHGIDWLGDESQKEELNLLVENGNYGWPYIYGNGEYNVTDQPPKSTWEAYAKKVTNPVFLLTAHSAPMALQFYTGSLFPDTYKTQAFMSFHGSWNRKDPKGYDVKSIKFENGKPTETTDFIKGFLSADGTSYFGRPVDIQTLPDGSLLVSEDANGIVYRISYKE